MVKKQIINAIITEKDGKCDARCGFCGKKLLEFKKNLPKNSKKVLTNDKKSGISISVKCNRCTYTNSFHT
jgi:phage FluMu protein Com